MRRIASGFALVLVATAPAFAQTPPQPRFDLNFSIGAFAAEVEPPHLDRYGDDWYTEGRYAVALGYYWTRHFKTEVEFAHTGEGDTYIQEFVNVPGTSAVQPISVQSFHRIQQTAVRGVWEFLPNTWVQPYVNAGAVFEADRQRSFSPQQFYYPPQQGPPGSFAPPIPVKPPTQSEPEWTYRGGVTAGGGAKFYLSPNGYINTALQITYAKPTSSVSFLAGFGLEF